MREQMRPVMGALACIAAIIPQAGPAHALQFTVTGVIKSMTPSGTSMIIECGTLRVAVNTKTDIISPPRRVTFTEFKNLMPFANSGFSEMTGAAKAGFVGANCTVDGDTFTISPVKDVPFATTLQLDIGAENLLMGQVTAIGTALQLSKIAILPQTDARMTAARKAPGFYNSAGQTAAPLIAGVRTEPYLSMEGFGIDPKTIPLNSIGEAAGYHGVDGKFYAHTINVEGRLLRTSPRASVQQAQCLLKGRQRDELRVQGGCVMPLGTSGVAVDIEYSYTADPAGATDWIYIGSAACNRINPLVVGPYSIGRYDYRINDANLGITCPKNVRVSNKSNAPDKYDQLYVIPSQLPAPGG